MGIDLHIHTTASDGTYSPREVVEMSKKMGLKAIAITDHDTTDGIFEALEFGKSLGVEVVPGIELNTDYGEREIHILGYYLNYWDDEFQQLLAELRTNRINRARTMVEKLNLLGIDISYQRVEEIAGEGAIGRPHLAKAIIEKGYAKEWDEVFQKYLGKNCPAYVPRTKLTPYDAVEVILKFGGVPVLAHPGLNHVDELIPKLVKVGLMGLEVYHYEHIPPQKTFYLKQAQKHGLIVTGGSDFHGSERSPFILGEYKLPEKLLDDLKQAKETRTNFKV